MKKIVLTGGGTLGHVTPHLSLIPHLLRSGYEIHYIGTEKGMEADKIRTVPDVTYHAVKSGKLRRYFSWQNFTDPFRVIAGAFQSAHLMGKLKPDVVFSKGGLLPCQWYSAHGCTAFRWCAMRATSRLAWPISSASRLPKRLPPPFLSVPLPWVPRRK